LTEQGAQARCQRRTVAVDLRQDWPTALQQAGFNPQHPTAWLAEGLLVYLSDDTKDFCARGAALAGQWNLVSRRWSPSYVSDRLFARVQDLSARAHQDGMAPTPRRRRLHPGPRDLRIGVFSFIEATRN
jgi:O-methyltransferase involved in polyketide biosynthesis